MRDLLHKKIKTIFVIHLVRRITTIDYMQTLMFRKVLNKLTLLNSTIMKKNTLTQNYTLLVFIFLLFFPILSNAQYTLQDDDVVVENGMIVSCNTNSTDWGTGDIIIPDHLDGQEIIGIPTIYSGVFEDKGITNVLLPNTIKLIGNRTFAMNDIVKFIVPNGVIFLGRDLFAAMNSLDTVVFEPNSNIRIISKDAFYVGSCVGCLAPVTFPNNVNSSFSNYIDTSGTKYSAGDTIKNYNKAYYADLPIHELTLDDIEFSNGVISGIYNLYPKIKIPSNLDGETVHSIGEKAFEDYCIQSIELPNTITSLGNYSFAYNNLKEIELPDNMMKIGDGVFSYNVLTTITIPNNVDSIGANAFLNNKLSNIEIPENNKYIGASAFNCNRISEINHQPTHGLIYSRNNDGTPDSTKIVSYGGSSDTIDFIPDTVTTIGKYAFQNVFDNTWNIKSITLPNKIRYIKSAAFYGNKLDSLIIPNSAIRVDDQAFGYNLLDTVIFQTNSNLSYFGMGVFSSNYSLESFSLPTPVLKDGYDEFLGWYDDTVKIEMPITNLWGGAYEARFNPIKYNIYYENVGTLNNNSNPSYYTIEHYVYLKSPNDSSGYSFAGWFLDGSFNDTISYPAIEPRNTGDISFYAKWIKVDVTGISNKEISQVLIYPNPLQDILVIKSKELYLIRLYDINGREVFRKKMQSTNESIDMNNLKTGIYIINFSNSNGIVNKKVLKY